MHLCSPQLNRKTAAPSRDGGSLFCCSKPVSRVLSFKTAIYLDAPLLTRSSRLPGTAGPACMSLHGVAPDRVYSDGRFHTPSGELLPRLSTLTAPPKRSSTVASGADPLCAAPSKEGVRRYISVALVLGSPPAGVTRYPCPAEPGLSSQASLSPRPRGCPAYCPIILQEKSPAVNSQIFKGMSFPQILCRGGRVWVHGKFSLTKLGGCDIIFQQTKGSSRRAHTGRVAPVNKHVRPVRPLWLCLK